MAALWAVYYFAAFSIGRYGEYKQSVIWIGGGLMVMLTVLAHMRTPVRLPKEGTVLGVFLLWTLTGVPLVANWPAYFSNLKLVAEMVAVVVCVGLVLRHSGGMDWFYLAFIAVVAFNILASPGSLDVEEVVAPETLRREAGLLANANALGFFSVMGFIGALAIACEERSWLLSLGSLGPAALCFYGVVASASRGAFLALAVVMVLWPVFGLGVHLRRRWLVYLAVGVLIVLTVGLSQFVLEKTYLGTRFQQARSGEDPSSQGRLYLVQRALKVFAANPVFGVGLGQFGEVSGSHSYTHNEWAELLSTTGLVGFSIYVSAYGLAWLRLTRCLRTVRDPVVRHRGNVVHIILIVLAVSGMVFRPNFLHNDSMFLLAVCVGTANWVEQKSQSAQLRAPGLRSAPGRCNERLGLWRKVCRFHRTRLPNSARGGRTHNLLAGRATVLGKRHAAS